MAEALQLARETLCLNHARFKRRFMGTTVYAKNQGLGFRV